MIIIKTEELQTAVDLSIQIPEFDDPYPIEVYSDRLKTDRLILTAYVNNEIAGFKVGYDRFQDDSFYSWMGGVLPEYRKQGVAEKLADHQEKWAKELGYKAIKLKTRKKNKAMIAFSLKRGFDITEEIPKIPEGETRIWMEKIL